MFYKFLFFSPDGAGGGSGEPPPAAGDAGGGAAGGGGVVTPPADEKQYTTKDLEEAKRRSYSSGLNETRKRDIAPLLAKAKEAGYEIDEFNETTFGTILSDATVGKKNATYSQEAKKKVDETEAKYSAYVNRYNTKVIDAALSPFIKDAIDEGDIKKLITSEMNFKVITDENGKEIVKVVDANGAPIRHDGFTDVTLEEAVKAFLQRKPHLLQPSGRSAISTGSISKGSIIEGASLEEIVNKPNKDWTTNDEKAIYKALKEGKVKLVNSVLTVINAQ